MSGDGLKYCRYCRKDTNHIYNVMKDDFYCVNDLTHVSITKGHCQFCDKELVYDLVEDAYAFCDCQEKKPAVKQDSSLADQFEVALQQLIYQYTDQGLTVGSMLGALANQAFNINLNIQMPSIMEVLKKRLKDG